jgi:hypothetical protein
MKNVCVLLVLIVAAAASMSAQEAPKKDGSQSARRYINLPKPVQGFPSLAGVRSQRQRPEFVLARLAP